MKRNQCTHLTATKTQFPPLSNQYDTMGFNTVQFHRVTPIHSCKTIEENRNVKNLH